MHITALLAQSEIVLPKDAPWWGVIIFACVVAIIRLMDRRVDDRSARVRAEIERETRERAERIKAEIEDRARDSDRQDNMLRMLQTTTALVSELLIKLNTSTEAAMRATEATAKEREALLSVVTANSGATHHAARQVENNTQVLISVSEIVQALKAQTERSTNTTDTARRTLTDLTMAIEALLRERIVQSNTSPEYNVAVEHLGKVLNALQSADLSITPTEQGDSNG